jgi:predicted MFS family arabinose efflux permease
MAVGTVAGSLLAGRSRAAAALERRVIALIALMSAGLAGAAAAAMHLALLGVVLVLPGLALGALFATLYVLVDQLAPEGSGTRTFAWLVTANNGGLALGAAIAGTLTERSGPAWGLWFAAVCALTALAPASAAAVMSARVPERAPI